MHKKQLALSSVLVLVIVLVGILASCSSPASPAAPGKVYEFRYSTQENQNHDRIAGLELPLHRQVEQKSNNRIKVNDYFSESLLKSADAWDGLVRGVSQLGMGSTSYTPGLFDLTDAVNLPGLGNKVDYYINTMAVWDLYKQFPEVRKPFDKVHMLYLWAGPFPYIFTTKPLKSLDDIKGLKIRSVPGPAFEALKLLGAVPIQLPGPDIYPALEKKTIDGAVTSFSGAGSLRLYEITKYCTPIMLGAGGVDWGALNMDAYNALPTDLKKVWDDTMGADAILDSFARKLLAIDNGYKDTCIKNGMAVTDLPKAEFDKWSQLIYPVADNWAKANDTKGFPGTKMVQYVKERQAYWATKE